MRVATPQKDWQSFVTTHSLIKATHSLASKMHHLQFSALHSWAFPHRLPGAHLTGTQQVLRRPSVLSACSSPFLFGRQTTYAISEPSSCLVVEKATLPPCLFFLWSHGLLMGKKLNPWTLSNYDCLVFATHRIFNHYRHTPSFKILIVLKKILWLRIIISIPLTVLPHATSTPSLWNLTPLITRMIGLHKILPKTIKLGVDVAHLRCFRLMRILVYYSE